jgi:uncharacterized protein YvpB
MVIRIMLLFTLGLFTVYLSAILNLYMPKSILIASTKEYSVDELGNEEIIKICGGNEVEIDTEKTIKINETNEFISVPYISQLGEYPTGCEIVSASMLLNYYNYNISVDDFIDNYLDSSFLKEFNGSLYGPHPNESFVGDPRSIYSYGCYAPVIVNSINKILKGEDFVENTTGSEFNELIENYVDKEIPVLVWVSINMNPTSVGTQWYVKGTRETFQWISNEHCMVLVGYDKDKYYFNDPYEDNGVVGYDKKLVEKRFKELGKQSVVISNNNKLSELYQN